MQIVIGIGTNIGYGGASAGPRLQIYVQPSGAVINTAFTTQPVVRVLNADGTLNTTFSANVTLTKVSGPGSLNGTQTVAASSGVATYSGLSVDDVGTYVLQATTTPSSITPANTDPFVCNYGAGDILLESGSKFLLEDGVSFILLES